MRILLFANAMPTFFASVLPGPHYVTGGWISAALSALSKTEGVSVGCCFPAIGAAALTQGNVSGVDYFGVPMQRAFSETPEPGSEQYFDQVLSRFNPDVIHLFGTEGAAALPLLASCGKAGLLPRACIHMQGLCRAVAEKYAAGLPERVLGRNTLRDRLRHDSVADQAAAYRRRAENEAAILQTVRHVIGRTDFDRAESLQINPDLVYHRANESLRDSFYDHAWSAEKAEPHSIFLSQGNYPLKGLHTALSALPAVLARYPDARLRVAGGDPTRSGEGLRGRLAISSFGAYIAELTDANLLRDRVTFLGTLDESGMLQEYLRAGLYLCASSIENSPNSLGEAMLLGLPIVSTNVGGIPSIFTADTEGRAVPPGDTAALSAAINAAFADPEGSAVMGQNARRRALITHDREKNAQTLLAIYREICAG